MAFRVETASGDAAGAASASEIRSYLRFAREMRVMRREFRSFAGPAR
jgi:hypothetical protein